MSVQYPSLDDYYNQTPGRDTSTSTPTATPLPSYVSGGVPPQPSSPANPGNYWVIDPATGKWVEVPIGTAPGGTWAGSTPGTLIGSPVTSTAATSTSGTSNSGGGPTSLSSLGSFGGYTPYPGFSSSFQFPQVSDAPGFTAPKFSYGEFDAPDAFKPPTGADALNEPGYAFRLAQGDQAITNKLAALGTIRGGAAVKGFADYNQNFASNEYQNVYARAASEYDRMFGNKLDVYKTNYGTATGVFDRNYQGARDEYAPSLMTWQAQTQAQQTQALAQFKREFDQYALTAGLDSRERDRQLQVFLTQMGIDAGQVLAILDLDD